MEAQVSGVGLQVKRSELKTWLGNCVVFLGNSRVRRAQPHNYTKQQQPIKPKKFGCTTIQGATFDMHGQLYCRHVNAMALSSSQCTGLQVRQPTFQSWPGQGIVPLRHAGKKMRAPLLGLAKSVYYTLLLLTVPFSTQEYRWVPANCQGSLKNLAMDWHSIKGGVTVITPSDYVLRPNL